MNIWKPIPAYFCVLKALLVETEQNITEKPKNRLNFQKYGKKAVFAF